YALPYEYYEKDGIRRYGFHGTSHRFVAGRCIELLGGKAEGTKIVTCHLGNGSSITAVKDGKCLDTTMGLTPLEGILMGTRCGSIDPAIVPTIMKEHNLTPDEMDTLMNKKSGMLGLAGTSDNRTIEGRAKEGDERAQLVESMLCHQLVKYIGGFAAAMGGLDAVVFTGGIGENNPQYRTRVAEKIAFLGTDIDEEKNHVRGKEIEISVPGSKVKMYVIPTNEELVIARDTKEIVENL
ncbi:MAG: acetate/propionate family kinase, partial [Clostridia bacterium]|nr:acetate/propionate family kinase [Clostridia bacterium]